MSVAQKINDYITAKAPAALCDKCIAEAVGLTNKGAHPAQVTKALGTTSDFTREDGTCSMCKSEKKVIRANRT
jgi:hypothetical protein